MYSYVKNASKTFPEDYAAACLSVSYAGFAQQKEMREEVVDRDASAA